MKSRQTGCTQQTSAAKAGISIRSGRRSRERPTPGCKGTTLAVHVETRSASRSWETGIDTVIGNCRTFMVTGITLPGIIWMSSIQVSVS